MSMPKKPNRKYIISIFETAPMFWPKNLVSWAFFVLSKQGGFFVGGTIRQKPVLNCLGADPQEWFAYVVWRLYNENVL